MLKRMMSILVLISLYAHAASDHCRSMNLACDQAQFYGLYPSVEDTAGVQKIASALFICEITPHGKLIFDRSKDTSFKVGVKSGGGLDYAPDCEFIELSDDDKLTICERNILLKLSSATIERIQLVPEDYHIRLKKSLEELDAFALWQTQDGKEEAKENSDQPSRLSRSADGVKEMILSLLQ